MFFLWLMPTTTTGGGKHLTDTARMEGFYKILHAEKAAYVSQYQTRVTRSIVGVVKRQQQQHLLQDVKLTALMIEECNVSEGKTRTAMPVSNMLGDARHPTMELSTLPDPRGFPLPSKPHRQYDRFGALDRWLLLKFFSSRTVCEF